VEPPVITLDTSAILSFLDRKEQNHDRTRATVLADRGPYYVPAGILSEVGFLIERRLGISALAALVDDLAAGRFTLDCGEQDLQRVGELVRKYEDLSLGIADAIVIACAERNGGDVLTYDLRHFGVVAREGAIRVLPQPAS
jgi:predicted nucleic acid-binding protein